MVSFVASDLEGTLTTGETWRQTSPKTAQRPRGARTVS